MNDILRMLGGSASGPSGMTILMQAIGAAMRGEDPKTFMKRLANNHPQLKRMNLDDLYGSAQQLCKEKGLNPDDVAKSIDGVIENAGK